MTLNWRNDHENHDMLTKILFIVSNSWDIVSQRCQYLIKDGCFKIIMYNLRHSTKSDHRSSILPSVSWDCKLKKMLTQCVGYDWGWGWGKTHTCSYSLHGVKIPNTDGNCTWGNFDFDHATKKEKTTYRFRFRHCTTWSRRNGTVRIK